jgi:ABC-2 type transport system ATP-binding protein
MGSNLLDVHDLTVCAAGVRIVDRVQFDVCEGEIVAVIGPNGAGKTSLLEALVGLRRCESGRITVQGRPITGFDAHARAFAFMPDAAVLPPELSVRTLVDLATSRTARPKEACQRLANELGLPALMNKSAGALSRGEGKRLGLFAALVLARPIVVLDEPFSAFDPLQLRAVMAIVRSIADAGTSIVVSIHQLSDAERICSRVLLLNQGRRVAFGSLHDLRAETGAHTLEDVFFHYLEQGPDVAP